MPLTKISITELLELPVHIPLLDVRSPGEFAHAHMPRATSFPLFNNEERKVIGTAYKQESREKAIKIGLASFGKNLVSMVEQVEKLVHTKTNPERAVIVHCWRGGMRSAAVAWLLDLYGFKVYLLTGGYKAYRRWALQQFQKSWQFSILGGFTGSNKTGIIQTLQQQGHKAIDLEKLAGHKGSAFGNLDRETQPSQEQFENDLAMSLYACSNNTSSAEHIWIEDESQRIGDLNIPTALYQAIRQQPFVFLDIPFEERLRHIVNGYAKHDREKLINAIVRIKKRLGGLEAKAAINFILEDDIENCFSVLLKYYDRLYLKSRLNRKDGEQKMVTLPMPSTNANTNTQLLLQHAE